MNINGVQKTGFSPWQAQTVSRATLAKPSETDTQKFDVYIPSQSSGQNTEEPTSQKGKRLAESMLDNASPEVKNAWAKAEELTGYNPYTDKEGKIIGSALFARHLEIEYNLELRYGAQGARERMYNLFSDTNEARSMISAALERTNRPMYCGTETEKEKQFYTAFLSYLE